MDLSQLRQQTREELQTHANDLRSQTRMARNTVATRRSGNVRALRLLKKELAQVETLLGVKPTA